MVEPTETFWNALGIGLMCLLICLGIGSCFRLGNEPVVGVAHSEDRT